RLASVTKPFTATAIMLLVEEGKIGLDDRVSRYLPELTAAWQTITLRHLLNMTSGLENYHDLQPPPSYRQDTTPEAILQLVAGFPLKFPPGQAWDYNSTSYILLRMILEQVSGQSYGEFLTERVFQPLGMNTTRPYDYREIIPNRAGAYTRDERLRN